jgi:hypothetical protein
MRSPDVLPAKQLLQHLDGKPLLLLALLEYGVQ